MPLLLLIRHGTNNFVKEGRIPGQAPNIHLNPEGIAQAEALAKLLEKQPISVVYASQLERAIETAWRIAGPRGLPIHIRPALADTDTGDFTAKTSKELSEAPETKEIWKTIVEKPSEGRLPNGESLVEMQQRVVGELARICAAHPDPEMPKPIEGQPPAPPPPPTVIAVVMHADPIKASIANFLGVPFDNFQRIGTSPASVSTIMVSDKHIMVINVNRLPEV